MYFYYNIARVINTIKELSTQICPGQFEERDAALTSMSVEALSLMRSVTVRLMLCSTSECRFLPDRNAIVHSYSPVSATLMLLMITEPSPFDMDVSRIHTLP